MPLSTFITVTYRHIRIQQNGKEIGQSELCENIMTQTKIQLGNLLSP